MRVAINLLTDDPKNPSGAHWFWTRMIPEMAKRLERGEELHLLVSPASRQGFQGYGPNVRYITYPWSNERQILRTLSEHLYSAVRLRLNRIDVFNTLVAPILRPRAALVIHIKTMHAYSAPESLSRLARVYRQRTYPRSTRLADAVIINSLSLKADVEHHLDVAPEKLHLIYEAVDHELFKPGDADEARHILVSRGVRKPFVLFVSSLWRYKNCAGLLRAYAKARTELGELQLVVVGPRRDEQHAKELDDLVVELGLADEVVFVGGVPLEETVHFYRAAEVLVYPSFFETFGLPVLEAMATGCPVVTSDVSSMPEIAGGAALLADPHEPGSIADAIVAACGPRRDDLRERGLQRAGEFTWAATAEATLEVYRQVFRARVRSNR